MIFQHIHHIFCEAVYFFVIFLTVHLHEVFDEKGDVLFSFSERGELDFDDVQAIKEVLPEFFFSDENFQICIGGGNDPHVHTDCAGAAQVHELSVLNDAQQLGLRFDVQRGDFIEKNRSLVCGFKKAFFMACGPCKCPFDVAKKVAFEQIWRQGTRIDNDEWRVESIAVLMYGPGDQFLSGPAFPLDQNGAPCRRGGFDEFENIHHNFAFSNDVFETEFFV